LHSTSELFLVKVSRIVLHGWINHPMIIVLWIISVEQKAFSGITSCDITRLVIAIWIKIELLRKTDMYLIVEDIIFGGVR
jgi:hypothetical protein